MARMDPSWVVDFVRSETKFDADMVVQNSFRQASQPGLRVKGKSDGHLFFCGLVPAFAAGLRSLFQRSFESSQDAGA